MKFSTQQTKSVKTHRLLINRMAESPSKPDYSTWMKEIRTQVNIAKGIKK